MRAFIRWPARLAAGVPLPLETVPSRGPDPFEGSRTMAFTCHECGDCCKGSAILLSPFDVARLAAFSKLTPRALIKERCVVLKHPQTELPAVMLETVPQCSFLREDNRCSVYTHRPLVCRGYPLGVLTDLNQPGWRNALQRFSIRANACPAPTNPNRGLSMVRTLHQMATGAGMEAYAEASRVWSRLTWDVSTESRYPSMSIAESLAFDREFLRLFFEEIPSPPDEGQALTAFVERVRDFRARHRLLHTPVAGVSTPPGASPA